MNAWQYFIDTPRVLVFVGAQAAIAISNVLLAKTLGAFKRVEASPRVSLLVPARDEEATIKACAESLLAQDYPDFEVILLDDGSTDRTAAILASLDSPRLRVLSGQALPDGWTGKTWACQQLADAATGELLLFTDADTVHRPDTVRQAVNARAATRADLLTAFTRSEAKTLGEQLTVPFVTWSIFSLLPLGLAYALRRSGVFSAANGKFLLFRREAYQQVGGHAAVKTDATEDLALCRLVKQHGLHWRLLDASRYVSARMYHGFGEAVDGFTKNLFALFGYRILAALFVWFWLMLITWHPIISITTIAILGDFGITFIVALVTIIMAAGIWLLAALKFGMPWHLCLLYPLTMTVSTYIGLRSMVFTIAGRTHWKDRTLVRRKARII
jgi:chlorobactene glucosyltransferase